MLSFAALVDSMHARNSVSSEKWKAHRALEAAERWPLFEMQRSSRDRPSAPTRLELQPSLTSLDATAADETESAKAAKSSAAARPPAPLRRQERRERGDIVILFIFFLYVRRLWVVPLSPSDALVDPPMRLQEQRRQLFFS